MVLTVSFVLSPVTGLSCHRRRCDAKHHHQLDASVGASGPHDFAVRNGAFRPARRRVHRIPHPTSVTTRTPLSSGRDGAGHRSDFSWKESGIFREPALDSQIAGEPGRENQQYLDRLRSIARRRMLAYDDAAAL
jgi:hypothetical protein